MLMSMIMVMIIYWKIVRKDDSVGDDDNAVDDDDINNVNDHVIIMPMMVIMVVIMYWKIVRKDDMMMLQLVMMIMI